MSEFCDSILSNYTYDIIKLVNANDIAFAKIAQYSKITEAILPSGFKVPSSDGGEWIIYNDFLINLPNNKLYLVEIDNNNLNIVIEKDFNWDIYTGEIKNNKFHGKCKLVFCDGGVLEGTFKEGKFITGCTTFETGEKIYS